VKLFAVFRIVALAVAMTGAGYLAGHAYVSNQKIVFYAALFALSQSIFWIVQSTRLRGIPGLGLAARICVLSALLLPIADWLYQPRSEQAAAAGPPEPAYSFRAAKGNPEAFSRWWAYYTNEWTKPDGGQARLQGPDPRGTLPYVLLPNTQGQFFQHMYHINNLGFHGRDFAAEKGNEYRIFVVGDSPVFDTLMQKDDHAWEDMLQTSIDDHLICDRPVHVINAGMPGSSMKNSLELLRRSILPLKPDLVLIYYATGSLTLLGTQWTADPAEPRRNQRASALFAEAEYRWSRWSYVRAQREHWRTSFSDADPRNSVYAQTLRELIQLAQQNNIAVALSTTSMAVTAQSPREVIDFYGRTFVNVDWLIFAVGIQNDVLSKLAEEAGLTLIDTRPEIAGEWDSDLFVDVVHFTRKGADRFAQRMFDGLVPVLTKDRALRCRTKSPSE
jgi:lysophospholipase L1-like esterase